MFQISTWLEYRSSCLFSWLQMWNMILHQSWLFGLWMTTYQDKSLQDFSGCCGYAVFSIVFFSKSLKRLKGETEGDLALNFFKPSWVQGCARFLGPRYSFLNDLDSSPVFYFQRNKHPTLPLSSRSLLHTPRQQIQVENISSMSVYYYDLREEMQ